MEEKEFRVYYVDHAFSDHSCRFCMAQRKMVFFSWYWSKRKLWLCAHGSSLPVELKVQSLALPSQAWPKHKASDLMWLF